MGCYGRRDRASGSERRDRAQGHSERGRLRVLGPPGRGQQAARLTSYLSVELRVRVVPKMRWTELGGQR